MTFDQRFRTGLFTVCIIVVQVLLVVNLKAQSPRAVPSSYTSSTNRSSIKVWQATAPNTDPNAITSSVLRDARLTTSYVDGLGRDLELVARQGSLITSGTPVDMVNVREYDVNGNEVVSYISSPSTAADGTQSDGSFKLNPFAQQASFYGGTGTNNPLLNQGETFYYGQSVFENSPLNRPTETTSAGNSWSGSMYNTTEASRRSAKIKYCTNTATDAVRVWTVAVGAVGSFSSYSSSAAYAAGTLDKKIRIDENGHQKIEFRDKDNLVILSKTQFGSTTDDGTGSGHSGWACTYYLYDDLGNLRCVVQPEGVNAIATNWVLTDATIIAEQCFRYEYDQRNRPVIKKVPGASEMYLVYDYKDRIVMTQDGRERGLNKWLVTLYDAQNRAEATGLVDNAFSGKTFGQHLTAAYSSSAYPFTSASVPSATYWEELTRQFFDNYDWRSSYGNPLSAAYLTTWDGNLMTGSAWPYPQANAGASATKGLVTGSRTKVLGTSTYLYSVNIYDYRDRLIQTQSQNISSTTVVDVQTTQYNWAGQPLINIIKQEKGSTPVQTSVLVRKLSYDDLGRLVKTEVKVANTLINGNAFSAYNTIAAFEYDALGQVKKKVLSPAYNSGAGLESIVYDYNIRGWLLGINRANMASTTNNNSFYCMDVAYDKITGSPAYSTSYVAAQYSGNIAGASWKTKGDPSQRKYDFSYDAQDRLLKADFNQLYAATWSKTDPGNAGTGLDFSAIMGDGTTASSAYDLNGNIKKMQQYGWKLGGGATTPIDNLTYGYYPSSNRLKVVVDEANDPQSTMGDFKTSSAHPQYASKTVANIGSITDYTYDANGALTKDYNKYLATTSGGDGITYNYLNLPEVINVSTNATTSKGTITYTYDAQGKRLSKKIIEGPTAGVTITTVQTYLPGCVYESKATTPTADPSDYADKLLFISHDEGRIRFEKATTATCVAQVDRLIYDYFIKDNLGSTRAVVTEQKEDICFIAATSEDARLTNEQKIYDIQDARRVLKSSIGATQTSFESKVYQTHGGLTGQKTGLGATIKVMAGDQVKITVESYYTLPSGGSTGSVLNMALTDLLTSFVGSTAISGFKTGMTTGDVQNVSTNSGDLTNFITRTEPSYTPKAYLNWILFDDQLKYVTSGADPVGTGSASGGAVYKQHTQFVNSPAIATKSGYLYVFVSNESNMAVYFDNLNLTHSPGPLVEESHYYPFGLTMKGISDKAIKSNYAENKLKYNKGSELQNKEFADGTGIELYETFYRSLDPQIGKFWQIDPKPNVRVSPYESMNNNPILYNDPLGDTLISAADQALAAQIINGINSMNNSLTAQSQRITNRLAKAQAKGNTKRANNLQNKLNEVNSTIATNSSTASNLNQIMNDKNLGYTFNMLPTGANTGGTVYNTMKVNGKNQDVIVMNVVGIANAVHELTHANQGGVNHLFGFNLNNQVSPITFNGTTTVDQERSNADLETAAYRAQQAFAPKSMVASIFTGTPGSVNEINMFYVAGLNNNQTPPNQSVPVYPNVLNLVQAVSSLILIGF